MIVGIDPGASGAIAWLDDFGRLIEVRDLPVAKVNGRTVLVPSALAAMLREQGREPIHAYVETMASRPNDGRVGSMALGRNFGMIEGVLAGVGVPLTPVGPRKWKRVLNVPADKSASRARAAQLWPGLAGTFARVKDDGRAEAALIGLYGANAMQGHGRAAA